MGRSVAAHVATGVVEVLGRRCSRHATYHNTVFQGCYLNSQGWVIRKIAGGYTLGRYGYCPSAAFLFVALPGRAIAFW